MIICTFTLKLDDLKGKKNKNILRFDIIKMIKIDKYFKIKGMFH